MKHKGQPVYGILRNGVFGSRIITGIVTGIRYTEDKPMYEISFGKDKWWTAEVYTDIPDLMDALYASLPALDRVKESHGLKIRYES